MIVTPVYAVRLPQGVESQTKTCLSGTPKQRRTRKTRVHPPREREGPPETANFTGRGRRQVRMRYPALLLPLGKATTRPLQMDAPDLALDGADKPEDIAVERASAAPNLAIAPHDGPDEPLLLCHNPSDGTETTS